MSETALMGTEQYDS